MKTHSVILTVVLTLVFVLSPYPRNFVAPGAPPVAWADDGTGEPEQPISETHPFDQPPWPTDPRPIGRSGLGMSRRLHPSIRCWSSNCNVKPTVPSGWTYTRKPATCGLSAPIPLIF